MSKPKEASNVPGGDVLVTLSLNDILVDETNNLSRYAPNVKDVAELMTDIVKRGQLQPVVVRYNPNGDGTGNTPYRLVAGFQRHRAITMANESGHKLQILARVVEADDRDALLDNLAENIKRRNQSPMDISYSIKALRDAGLTAKEVATEYGKSQSWISNYAGMITLRPHLQKAIHSGEIPVTVARNLPQMGEKNAEGVFVQDEKAQDEALEAVKTAAATGMDIGAAAVEARQKKKGKSKTGAKAKGEALSGKGGISAKAAIGQFERLTLEVEAVEKPTKLQQRAVELYKVMTKFLLGKIGAQTMDRKVAELL